MEMSYVTEDDVLEVGEEIFYDVFSKFSNKKYHLVHLEE